MATSEDVRSTIVQGLEADLVGPFYPAKFDGAADELLPLSPSRWYLTGFLAPERDRETRDPTAEEELASGVDDDAEEQQGNEPEPKQKHRFPASMGVSVLLPPAGGARESMSVRVSFAEYVPEAREEEGKDGKKYARTAWRRFARAPHALELGLDADVIEKGVMLPDTPGIWVKGKLEDAEAPGLDAGTRALSLFVVNRRTPSEEKGKQDTQFVFQVRMELEYTRGFVPRPNWQGEGSREADDAVADLQFRNRFEYAVGHGVSVEAPTTADEKVTRIATTWVPRHEVLRVRTREEKSVTTRMEDLAKLSDGAAVRDALTPLTKAYGEWLVQQSKTEVGSQGRDATKNHLLKQAEAARKRIEAGIERIASDADVLHAFRLTNEAMATSALKRSPGRYDEARRPTWHLFQLAFLLLNIEGIGNDQHEDRRCVDLIFFPTGGGKTEAYLGVIAFTLLLRRIRGQQRPDKGLGVAVLLRYTLRLLTLDQLGRAATLMCALETIRQKQRERLGNERFAVGLWVGRSATDNTLDQLKKSLLEYKNSTSKNARSPFPLTNCPWCNKPLTKDGMALYPSPSKTEGIVVSCADYTCDFSERKNREGLPVLFVDEQIYRELPSFMVATVDKFAMLPWRGETGMLFGRASWFDGQRFFGPMDGDKPPKNAAALPEGLRPPELVVQDELHLISGPLGTMVGLYETAIDYLATTRADGARQSVRPKVIASTATVRRAREQIRALFGTQDTSLFPPPGINESETWFAEVDRKHSGRLYVGVAAQGRSMKGILLRTYVTLLAAAQKKYAARGTQENAEAHPADPYMTLAGYFNSLRELGGMRRLVEDEVHTRCRQVEDKRPVDHKGAHPLLANRTVQIEPIELTSRKSTGAIKDAKDRLNFEHSHSDHVDVVLASNMISVGVDIDRLGLMVVAGQPKTTAEYIQASSRVGRQFPGLVITCFNIAKPRDRSHYERFAAYHASFYRFVEAMSLTPFSGPALERGLAGTLVAMMRLAHSALTPAEGAMAIEPFRRELGARAVGVLAERAGTHHSMSADEHDRLVESVRNRGEHLLDAWEILVKKARDEGATKRSYSRFDRDKSAGRALLTLRTDEKLEDLTPEEEEFIAPTSMRDVEASVHLWVVRQAELGSKGSWRP